MTAATAQLAPDPLFARRDELLDDQALCRRLSALLDDDVVRCRRMRATYHPGRSLRILLHVEARDATRCISARMFAAGTSASRFERARLSANGAVLHDEDLATVFSVFPVDRKLATLPCLARASWPAVPGTDGTSFRLVAYAPEKGATAMAVDREGRTRAFVKIYADDATPARTIGAHKRLQSLGVRVPAVLAAWPELRAVALEPLHGTRLAVRGDARDWRAFGATLAHLHRMDPVDARRFTRLEPRALTATARTIAALRPDVAGPAAELERALRRTVPRHQRLVCLHGDVHPKNVLLDAGGAALLDLDDVSAGAAAADLGSALAGLRYEALLGRGAPGCAQALLDGYRQEAPAPDAHALRWYTAAALLGERALRSITRLRSTGLERLDAVLAAGLEQIA